MDSSCKDIAVPVQCAAPVSVSLFCSAHLVSTQVLEMDSKHSLPAALIPEIVSEQAGQPEDPSAPSAQTPPACLPPDVDQPLSVQTPPACLPPDVDQTPPACLPPDVDQTPPACLPPDVDQTPPACLPPDVDQTPPACLPPDVDQPPSGQTPPACLHPDVDQPLSVQTPPTCLPPDVDQTPPACLPPDVNQTPPACLPPDVDQTPPACLPPDVDQPPSVQTPPACLPPDVNQPPSVQRPPCGSLASDSCLSEPQDGLDSPPLSPADESTGPESLSSCSPPSSAEPFVVDSHFPFTAHEDDYCINAEEICFWQLLGQGGFGTVHLATYRGQTVAVKSFSVHRSDEVIKDTYQRELNALKCRLQHRNVVAVLGATCVEGWDKDACIVMQYAGGENLQSFLLNSNHSMPVERVIDFASQIAAGLDHIHSKKLIHMDIKPANCIVNTTDEQHPTLLITDFGLSSMESAPWNARNLGTVPFRAPELFRGKLPSFSSDVYSLAVLMWCLDVRELPYPSMSPEIIIWRTVASHMRPQLPESCDCPLLLQYRQLYQECWSADPAGRPTLQRMLNVLNEMHQSCSCTKLQ